MGTTDEFCPGSVRKLSKYFNMQVQQILQRNEENN